VSSISRQPLVYMFDPLAAGFVKRVQIKQNSRSLRRQKGGILNVQGKI
jgi:hypothetical protein